MTSLSLTFALGIVKLLQDKTCFSKQNVTSVCLSTSKIECSWVVRTLDTTISDAWLPVYVKGNLIFMLHCTRFPLTFERFRDAFCRRNESIEIHRAWDLYIAHRQSPKMLKNELKLTISQRRFIFWSVTPLCLFEFENYTLAAADMSEFNNSMPDSKECSLYRCFTVSLKLDHWLLNHTKLSTSHGQEAAIHEQQWESSTNVTNSTSVHNS